MRLKVVICGSFHRDTTGLQRIFRELEITGCRIIAPISVAFSDTAPAVVKTENEYDLGIRELELFHLRAIRDADFIWLHAPGGHIGISASYELGFAHALQKQVLVKKSL